ncbi:DNA-binding transcriptional regulator [Endozoicomonas sp. OPT23]|uniref:helix-turn-helix transcriptional regulator n=1 Tax=Endozoicomonas sp. OPT23 TaxID=2072845 RepID=UPI00129B4B19|nr:YafY family protein [Endozoicomonas sp. OPT23]MRI34901.1 DNA-binding transcriptional regulator [Endozoicomonas sp. OPT23]
MNRFDRVTSILLLLQTRSVVTAQYLSEYFDVSDRTIYRDIRTLETAGVPIGSEAGVGYFLEKSYHLPPVSFTLDEAASLLLGEKLLVSSLDADSLKDFKQALNKIKAVVDRQGKDYLSSFDTDVEVLPTSSHFPIDEFNQNSSIECDPERTQKKTQESSDRWLRECRDALVHRKVIEIDYAAFSSQKQTKRCLEPIGLFYYSWHWHLVAWCRLRCAYRDFRLDRIMSFVTQAEQFPRHSRITLQQYVNEKSGHDELQEVELLFTPDAARYVQEQRYMFGFLDEETLPDGVKMRFLTHLPEYMARWLLQYTDGVRVIKGDSIRKELQKLSAQLAAHWRD